MVSAARPWKVHGRQIGIGTVERLDAQHDPEVLPGLI
jgi:hypothetical protein